MGHGGNDAQKNIGILWMLLIATGYAWSADTAPPNWIIVCRYAAIAVDAIVCAWIFTIPASAFVAAVAYCVSLQIF